MMRGIASVMLRRPKALPAMLGLQRAGFGLRGLTTLVSQRQQEYRHL